VRTLARVPPAGPHDPCGEDQIEPIQPAAAASAVTVSVADDAAVLLAFCAVMSALAGRVLV